MEGVFIGLSGAFAQRYGLVEVDGVQRHDLGAGEELVVAGVGEGLGLAVDEDLAGHAQVVGVVEQTDGQLEVWEHSQRAGPIDRNAVVLPFGVKVRLPQQFEIA